MHCITLDKFPEEAEEEEIEQGNQQEQAKQTEPEQTTSEQPGKGKAGPKAKPKNLKSFKTKPVNPKPNCE